MFRIFSIAFFTIVLVGALDRTASASVQTYTDFTAWGDAVPSFTTITFADISTGIITDQYAELGVLFTDGNDAAILGPTIFPIDGFGINGGPDDQITLEFSQLNFSLGFHFPGGAVVQLYHDDVTLGEPIDSPTSGIGNFLGIVSDIGFDRAVIYDPDTVVAIDNLYFGPPIPAPTGLALLALAAFGSRRRRTRMNVVSHFEWRIRATASSADATPSPAWRFRGRVQASRRLRRALRWRIPLPIAGARSHPLRCRHVHPTFHLAPGQHRS